MAETYGNFIAGEWVKASSGKTFDSTNPANTDELVARYQSSTTEDVKNAFDVAQKAQPAWAGMPAPNRGIILMRAAEILEKRAESVAPTTPRKEDTAKPSSSAREHLSLLRW
jgi:aldehyde dehydrogenase (NAD+)